MNSRKIIYTLLISLLLVGFISPLGTAQANTLPTMKVLDAPQSKIDSALQGRVNALQTGESMTVIVTLRQQAVLSQVAANTRAARQQGVIRALQAVSDASQTRLKNLLDARQSQGDVSSYTSFWIFNGFSVTANSAVINELAQHPDVFSITAGDLSIVPAYAPAETNIANVNAPALWDLGLTGQGIVVANLDSGVDVSHPELSARWRGGSNSWFDPYDQHSTPFDKTGHGTQITGIMVGGDGSGTSIGMAPNAQWIAAKIFRDDGYSDVTKIHESFQWLLDPDHNPATADAPNVVNNSWSFANPGCYLDFESDLQSLRAAGILPIFAAGNGGPYSNSSFSPANNPAAFAVGAINNTNSIYNLSSRGPSTCGGSTGPFPELVAPGVSIKTTNLFQQYTNAYSGTSYSAPHVAGGLALLLAVHPDLSALDQQQALIQSAVDLGVAGPDDTYGYGRLDILAAYNWLTVNPTSTPEPTFTPTFTPTSIPIINLALNRPVTVSSYQDSTHTGAKAVDGDSSTLWQTAKVKGKGSTTEWIEVDLGSNQNVSQVVLEWNSYYATGYNIQTSTDHNNWTPVFSTTNGNGGNDTLTFNTVQARYVRMTSSSWSSGSYRNWLNEIGVYAMADGQSSPPSPSATPTSIPNPGAAIHVGDLDATSAASGNGWKAIVTIAIHDTSEAPVQGVTVAGSWGNGATGTGSCVTGSDGTCTISRNNLKSNISSVSFGVASLSSNQPYDSTANHDVDGESNGTTINVTKP